MAPIDLTIDSIRLATVTLSGSLWNGGVGHPTSFACDIVPDLRCGCRPIAL